MKNHSMPMVFLISLCAGLCSCGPGVNDVDRIFQDGVETILNHLDPYQPRDTKTRLILEKKFVVDSEMDEIAGLGLVDIGAVAVDDDGHIFMLNSRGESGFVFKFDEKGRFVVSFGNKGQGPGEIQAALPGFLLLIENEIIVADVSKMLVFNREGGFLREMSKVRPSMLSIIPLSNGCFLVKERVRDEADPAVQHVALRLYDPAFRIKTELSRVTRPNPSKGKGWSAILPYINYYLYKDRIFEGTSEGGYEIRVYDLDGRLLRRIRKDFIPVSVTGDDKGRLMQRFSSLSDTYRIFAPDSFPAYQRGFFADSKGRLFVMTHEKGGGPREFIYDIFNPEGAFIGRISLDNMSFARSLDLPLPVLEKNGNLYCVREKESGFKELIVYGMTWR
jgi:6-bladed beta-propeller protein